MKLTSKPLAVLIVVFIFGGIIFSSALGWWQTEGGQQGGNNGRGQTGERSDSPGYGSGFTDMSIRGRTTFAELLDWGLPEAQIDSILGVAMPEDRGMLIKDFCQEQGLEFGEVKADLQAAVDEVR